MGLSRSGPVQSGSAKSESADQTESNDTMMIDRSLSGPYPQRSDIEPGPQHSLQDHRGYDGMPRCPEYSNPILYPTMVFNPYLSTLSSGLNPLVSTPGSQPYPWSWPHAQPQCRHNVTPILSDDQIYTCVYVHVVSLSG